MTVEIDEKSGFCFGVVNAIRHAERELAEQTPLYCLGDIVHNNKEVERLNAKGMVTINHAQMQSLKGVKVLLRAHGEPPSTYQLAQDNDIKLIDATCPVVLMLQQRIKEAYQNSRRDNPGLQIVIYGRKGHAEVNGLVGQTDGTAIVIENEAELDKLDYTRDIALYSQTTKSVKGFENIIAEIKHRMKPEAKFVYFDTICRQVANRVQHLRDFAKAHDVVLFVTDAKSSNGKVLYDQCRAVNPRTYLTIGADSVEKEWLTDANTIGICGATSTPRWLMEEVAQKLNQLIETKL